MASPRASISAPVDQGPGAAMRALEAEKRRQRRRRRRTRAALGAVALLVVGYLAVTTFVFNPLEGAFIPFPNAIPRASDFFVRKVGLADDLPLPATEATPFREDARLWKAFEEGKLFLSKQDVAGLLEGWKRLEASFEGTPIDPVRDLLGREVALAGTFPEKGGIAASRFGLYLRVSWRVRAAMGLARYSTLRDRFAAGMRVERRPSGTLRVSGLAGRDLYVARDKDLLLVASDEAWIDEARALAAERGQGSFGQSAAYGDDISARLDQRKGSRTRAPSNLQAFVQVPSLRRALGATAKWPHPESGILEERLLAGLFNTELPREAAGFLRFERQPPLEGEEGETAAYAVKLDAGMSLNTGVLGEFGKRFTVERPIPKNAFDHVAAMVPQSSFAFGGIALPGGAIARQIESLLTPEDRRMCDDAFRRSGRYDSLRSCIEDFAVGVTGPTIFALHDNAYPALEKDPKTDGGPQPAIAFAFPLGSAEKIQQLKQFFQTNRQQFFVEETYTLPLGGGYQGMEYYCPMPGTGEVVLAVASNWVFVSNQGKFLKNIVQSWLETALAKDKPYDRDPAYARVVAEQEDPVSAFLYVDGAKSAKALRRYVDFWVRQATLYDPQAMRMEREAVFAKLLKERHPQYVGQSVPPKVRAELDKVVDERMAAAAEASRKGASPELRARYEEMLDLLEAIPGAFVSLRVDSKRATAYACVEIR